MKALKIVIIILVVIVAIIMVPPLFMPAKLNVEISRVLEAQPEVIWDQVNCLENWEQWDLWHQDSNMVGKYEGPACGEGAKNTWTYKNTDDGGSQTIVEAKEYEYIKTFLDFQKMGTAEAEMFLEKVDDGTKVTWTLVSDSPYPIMRWVNTLLVGPGVTDAYTDGLANLDELTKDMKVEPKYTTGEISITLVKAMPALALRVTAATEEMATAMESAFGQLFAFGAENMAGPPFAIWYEYEGPTFVFDNCIPVTKVIPGEGDIKSIMTYEGKVVKVAHTGSYESTQYSWGAMEKYVQENSLQTNGDPYEVYLTNPEQEPDPNKWVTELYWPIK